MTTTSLTETQVREFVVEWYRKLDVHVPLPDLLPLLSGSDLTMKFPEATLHSLNEFAGWYDKVTHRFFDEVHTVKSVKVRFDGGKADCDIVVNWQASTWDPPEAASKRRNMDSVQRWLVSAEGDQLVVNLYDVISLTPLPGSAPL
jgi:hypothetical protein